MFQCRLGRGRQASRRRLVQINMMYEWRRHAVRVRFLLGLSLMSCLQTGSGKQQVPFLCLGGCLLAG